MSPFRYRDEEPTSRGVVFLLGGAIAGFAAGVIVAQRFGGVGEIAGRLRERFGEKEPAGSLPRGAAHAAHEDEDYELDEETAYANDEFDEDSDGTGLRTAALTTAEIEELSAEAEELEQRVLEAYRNDPILGERPVDIGAISDGIIELTGWVNTEGEAEHAVTLARGVPGVETVVNRLAVRPDDERYEDFAARYAAGDAALTESHWEGQHIGTGRRRQGNSGEPDRHSDPRPDLEDRWTRADAAIAQAAGDVGERGQRATSAKRSNRAGHTDGSPVAPGGVPKADHVADPDTSPPRAD